MIKLVYCGEEGDKFYDRQPKGRVTPRDIVTALAIFKEKTGTPAEVVEVCAGITGLESVIPEGVTLLPDAPCWWDLWLSSTKWDGIHRVTETFEENPPATPPPTIPDNPLNKKEVTETPCNMSDKRRDVKKSPVTALPDKSYPPSLVLPKQKPQRIKKEVLTRYNANPVKVDAKVPVTVPSKPVTKPKVVTVGVTKANKVEQLALIKTLDARIIELFENGMSRREKSSRTIADKLAGEDFNISHMTVNRRIRDYLESQKEKEEV